MDNRLKKLLLLVLAVALLFGVSRVQRSLNHDREQLGLTHTDVLENAPPVLAFTTVALGGFRGLISNFLWIRATELQEEDKFFEMAQLADWITKLEPHFTQVWIQQAWNMAYNISVKFKDFPDRWNWVQRGIELLRDQGLKYNPNDLLLYRELGWLFQHKLGYNLDDAHNYYKRAWHDEMSAVFKDGRPDFDGLIQPLTDDARARATLLRDKYKLDPQLMKEIDGQYGPLEWRLPEAHAIYWAVAGLKKIQEHPERSRAEDTMTLHRMIYQSLHQSVLHGRVVYAPQEGSLELGPDLSLLKKASDAYEQALLEEPESNHDGIRHAHLNLIREAVYFLYTYNHRREATAWFDYLARNFPDSSLLSGVQDSSAKTMGLDEYAIARVEEIVQEADSQDRVRLIIEGLIRTSLYSLALGEEDRAEGYEYLARKALEKYRVNMAVAAERVPLPAFNEIKRSVLQQLLDPERGLSPTLADQLRTALNLPAATNTPTATPSQ